MNTFLLAREKNKTNAVLTGVLFIVAAISSIAGLKLYGPILASTDFLVSGTSHYNEVIAGAICELILSVSAIGTAVTLFPYLKRYNESFGIGYLSFRIMEVVLIVIGTSSILTVLSISQSYNNGDIAVGRVGTHEIGHWLGLYHPYDGSLVQTTCDYYDDFVDDTPPQRTGTGCGPGSTFCSISNCPTFPTIDYCTAGGVALNSPNGRMYVNFMDLTNDFCINTFYCGAMQPGKSSIFSIT